MIHKFYLIKVPNCRSSGADNLNMPKRSHKVFSVSESPWINKKKEKNKSYAKVAKTLDL